METNMKVIATPIEAGKLKPGDLFSTADQMYWDNIKPESIGEAIYIRTEAPAPKDEIKMTVFKIRIVK